jgi:hypothetical protein
MTAGVNLLGSDDCARLLERLDELRDLDRLMHEPGTLAAPDKLPEAS